MLVHIIQIIKSILYIISGYNLCFKLGNGVKFWKAFLKKSRWTEEPLRDKK